MDHEAYETQMIDSINRHGEEAAKEKTTAKLDQVITKNDTRVVVIGVKRMLIALLTAALFTVSVIGLIAVARAPGYLAVVLFFASIAAMVMAFIFLYAQGITRIESQGESK